MADSSRPKHSVTEAHYKNSTVIPVIDDIYDFITWSELAKCYFHEHSVSWFYNKMRGVDGNGGKGDFTADERNTLKRALNDIADRIREASEKL